VVQKPVPQRETQDARGYQVEQLRRRYSPKESELANGDASLFFYLKPSDPDFPFDLDYLELDLRIPASYPVEAPELLVKNSDIPRGFAINIEKGWDRLVREKRGATLLTLTNALDKNLESFLSEQKAETVKLVTFKASTPEPASKAPLPAPKPDATEARRSYVPNESFSRDQISQAKARRAQEIRQLEARMGRMPLYEKSSDGVIYTLPLEPKRRTQLPAGLQQVKSVQLIIPLLYPLQPLRALLNGVESEDAEPLEELFSTKATAQQQMTLMSHVNYLAQNLHVLAKQAQTPAVDTPAAEKPSNVGAEAETAEHSSTLDSGKSHIHVIPRPPEWAQAFDPHGSGSSDEEYSDEGDEEGCGVVIKAKGAGQPAAPTSTPERGTAMSFPSVELHGIELLQVSILSLSVKCERCKTINDITGLRGNVEKTSSCKKCAILFAVTFRPELVHQNSTRAGFIDAAGCTVSDLLPSTFVPTCGNCSTPAQGLVSVRGDATTNVCRECHGRFTFKIPEVKFLAYAPGMARQPPTSSARRRVEKLGLHAGEALPDRGACGHYKRSYRWFRFSCCSKVYPCDLCHDAGEEHINEWANRMICGWCSREQNYSVESCAFCGRSVIGKRGSGYWEGGKGTRNQVLMRRGDKRKYRRIGGSAKAE